MKTTHYTFALLATSVFLACNPKQSPSSQNDTSQVATDKIDTGLVNNDIISDFAEKAAIGGMMEVESSARMIKLTENPDIQTLATMMVKDHGAANKELEAIANKQQLNLPQSLPADKLSQLDNLVKIKEELARNRAYAQLMLKEHEEAVALFTNAIENEQDGALKAFALKHLPTLKAHLLHAQSVERKTQ